MKGILWQKQSNTPTSKVLAIQKRVASSTWNIGKTSRALELGHWETSRALELGLSETADRALEWYFAEIMTGNIFILHKTLLCSLVVVGAHDSAHLVCVQCFTVSCGGTEDTSWWAWWVRGRRDLSLFRWVAFSMTSCSRWSCWHALRPNTRVAASRLRAGGAISASTGSWSTWPCYGAKGSIEADIHEMSLAASAPHRAQYSAGAYTSARVDVLNVGVLAPQLVPARRRINAVRAMTLPRSAVKNHDIA